MSEGEFLHLRIFGFPAPVAILARYAGLMRTLGPSAEWPQGKQVMSANLDIEAIEYAFRWRRRHHPLQQRIHGLCFLCESHQRYWDYFHNAQSTRVRAWLQLSRAGARSVWLLIKGSYLIKRYGLV